MNRTDGFDRRDWWIAAVFFLLALFLYAPFRSRMAYHWDGAEFTVAIRDYNVALSQPHAPGYFLYVMAGRLVNWFVGDPHASLVWMSVVAGGGLTAVMYLLGTAMFERRAGIAAGLFAMSSPQLWFQSCVALTYAVDALLVCVTVLWCWRAIQRGGDWLDAVVIGGLLAVIGGVRQQTVPGLLPLVVFTFWKFRTRRMAKLMVGGAVSVMGALAWFVPMVRLSGGLSLYWRVVRRFSAFLAQLTVFGGGWDSLIWNVSSAAAFCWCGLLLAAAVLAGALAYRILRMDPERKRIWNNANAAALQILAVWIAPMVVLGVTVSFTVGPGHVLSYLPAFWLLAAVAAAQLRKRLFIVTTAAVVIVNATAFLLGPPSWDAALLHTGLNAHSIREHDEHMEQTTEAIRSRYSPSDAIVCHARGYLFFGIRQFQLYLPEFEQYQMGPDRVMVTPKDKPVLSIRNGRWEFVSGIARANKHLALLIVPPDMKLEIFNGYCDTSRATEVAGSSGTVYAIPLEAVSEPQSTWPSR